MKRRELSLVIFLAAIVLLAGGRARGEELRITDGAGSERHVDISFDSGSREFMVVFTDFGPDCNLSGQRVVDGTLVGSEFPIATSTQDEQYPAIASKEGQSLVVWEHGVSYYDVRGQRVASDGSLIGSPIIIAQETLVWHADPDVAYSGASDRYLVVWREGSGSGSDIYGRLVKSDGTMGSTIAICTTTGAQANPKVAYNRLDQEFLVVWDTGDSIHGQRLSSDGMLVGGSFLIADAPNYQQYPAVAHGAYNNRYLVVWQDRRTGIYDVYGQFLSASGTLVGSEMRISTSDDLNDKNPDIAYEDLGPTYKVVWDTWDDSAAQDVFSRLVDYDGDLYPVTATCTHPASQSYPAVAAGITDTNYQSLAVWSDSRNYDTTITDIYGYSTTGPSIRVCGKSRVNLACGTAPNILRVNASPGGRNHDVHVPVGTPISVTMDRPPAGPDPAPFALYVWLGQPDDDTVTPHPKNLGSFCFPSPITGGAPQPKKIWNNIGRTPVLGEPTYPSEPAPSEPLSIPSGIGFPVTVVFQGLILDACSSADKPASITNAIMLMVE